MKIHISTFHRFYKNLDNGVKTMMTRDVFSKTAIRLEKNTDNH